MFFASAHAFLHRRDANRRLIRKVNGELIKCKPKSAGAEGVGSRAAN